MRHTCSELVIVWQQGQKAASVRFEARLAKSILESDLPSIVLDYRAQDSSRLEHFIEKKELDVGYRGRRISDCEKTLVLKRHLVRPETP